MNSRIYKRFQNIYMTYRYISFEIKTVKTRRYAWNGDGSRCVLGSSHNGGAASRDPVCGV